MVTTDWEICPYCLRVHPGRPCVDQGNALLKEQQRVREADPRPSEEIIRELRDEWHT